MRWSGERAVENVAAAGRLCNRLQFRVYAASGQPPSQFNEVNHMGEINFSSVARTLHKTITARQDARFSPGLQLIARRCLFSL
jgi:hypothetical protein